MKKLIITIACMLSTPKGEQTNVVLTSPITIEQAKEEARRKEQAFNVWISKLEVNIAECQNEIQR